MSYLQTEIITHTRKVCSLYKRALRCLESHHTEKWKFRYEAVMLRQRLEANRKVTDMREAKVLLLEGEKELIENAHYQPLKFWNSPGGVCYGREVIPQDWVLDYWHPLEKAMYPDYFARREERKKEFVTWYEKTYGKPQEDHHH
ncbi:unnamed protein product [Darwinula stevensoni]|uniref:NADH dehydrogenase [ubiquinone] 1 beta subcomplex subunit 9 n=1 Tax=Darwinula stevensoni TaxID=69355 RepID=A0A7R8XA24_9CRUS|nr:unnamed protein product [Darwinula stevensoni]CAG0883240.1 unnamed protein product [Darwinula stevensoni]